MSAFGLNRYTQAYAVAVRDAGTRIADKPLTCVDRLVWDLWKYAGALETAWKIFYPFVGGTAVSNSFNLIDPKIGRITWTGNVTHNANGITGDGATAVGATGVSLAGTAVGDSFLLFGIYCRTANSGNISDFGNYTGSRPGFLIQTRWSTGYSNFYIGGGMAYLSPNSQGLFTALRTGSPDTLWAYRNGTFVISSSNAGVTGNSFPFYLLGRRGSDTDGTDPSIDPSFVEYSNRNLALAFLSKGTYQSHVVFGDQVSFYNNVIQPFQVRLGRNV